MNNIIVYDIYDIYKISTTTMTLRTRHPSGVGNPGKGQNSGKTPFFMKMNSGIREKRFHPYLWRIFGMFVLKTRCFSMFCRKNS